MKELIIYAHNKNFKKESFDRFKGCWEKRTHSLQILTQKLIINDKGRKISQWRDSITLTKE